MEYTEAEMRRIAAMAGNTLEELQEGYTRTSEIMQRVRSRSAYDLNAEILEAYSWEIQRRKGTLPKAARFYAR